MLAAPLRLLGFGQRMTAADMAAAALGGELDEAPVQPEAEPSYGLGDLIRAHAERRLYGEEVGAPGLAQLPSLIEAWLAAMDRSTLQRVHTTPSRLLEAHIAAGPDGELRSLGLVVPRPDVPASEPMPAPRRIASSDLTDVLASLGYGPVAHRVRAR